MFNWALTGAEYGEDLNLKLQHMEVLLWKVGKRAENVENKIPPVPHPPPPGTFPFSRGKRGKRNHLKLYLSFQTFLDRWTSTQTHVCAAMHRLMAHVSLCSPLNDCWSGTFFSVRTEQWASFCLDPWFKKKYIKNACRFSDMKLIRYTVIKFKN